MTARLRQTSRPTQSTVRLPEPRQFERVTCYKCGSLFSSDGNSDCEEFDASDASQQGLCGAGEVCLTYTWQKSRSDYVYLIRKNEALSFSKIKIKTSLEI